MARNRRNGWNKVVAAVVLTAALVVSSFAAFVPIVSAQPKVNNFYWLRADLVGALDVEQSLRVYTNGQSEFVLNCSGQGTTWTCVAENKAKPDRCKAPTLVFNGDSTKATLQLERWVNTNPGRFGNTVGECSDKKTLEVNVSQEDKAPAELKAGFNPGAEESDPTLKCGTPLNPLNWFICPIIKGITALVYGLDNAIISLMTVDQKKIFNEDCSTNAECKTAKAYRDVWSAFRNIALAILVIAALIMVIAQALGFPILDAYTVKKVLPRLILAIIGISLSWELMRFLIILFNDLGLGVRQLIYAPFKSLSGDMFLNGGATAVAALLGAGAVLAFGLIGLASFALTALLAVGVAFLVLIIRQLVIVFLAIVSPIWMAAYILPNTAGIGKLGWESFSKALLMFPIISLLIAGGRVFAAVAIGGNISSVPAISQLFGFVAYFGPYFIIPATFTMAGGAMRFIGGKFNDTSRGGFDRLKKYRQGAFAEHGGRRLRNAEGRILQKRADIQDTLLKRASQDSQNGTRVTNWARRRAYRAGAGLVGDYNLEQKMSARRTEEMKVLQDQVASGRDEEVRALTVNKQAALAGPEGELYRYQVDENGNKTNIREFKTLGGSWQSEGYVDRAQQRWGNNTFAQQAALSYEMRKATTEEQLQDLSTRYKSVATGPGGWGNSENQAGGTWIGAAFENQQAHLEYKHTNWKTGKIKADKFAEEVYEKKGSYPLSQMGSNTIVQLKEAYDTGDMDTKRKVQAVAENFVSRYSTGGGLSDDDDVRAAQQTQQAMQGAKGMGGRDQVTTNASGAAHVAEQVNELARHVGVYQQRSDAARSTTPFPPIDHQR